MALPTNRATLLKAAAPPVDSVAATAQNRAAGGQMLATQVRQKDSRFYFVAYPADDQPMYTISGTLNPAKEITVPGNTRVLVLWTVISEDSGYSYVFGEGTVDFVDYSFIINFDGARPTEAMNPLNDLSLGYGRVILTANQ